MVKPLVRQDNVSPEFRDTIGIRPRMSARGWGLKAMVCLLLAPDDVNVASGHDEGHTALMVAAMSNVGQ